MTGRQDAQWLALVREFRPPAPLPGPGCLDDDTIAALAEGLTDTPARASAMEHLAGCARCRQAVASVARALADPEVAAAIRQAETGGSSRRRRVGGLAAVAAAAAVVMLLVWPGAPWRQPAAHRAAPITAAPAPQAVWPVGPVAQADSLRWTTVAGADRYRVTLFGADGSVRFAAELAGTSVALPDSVRPSSGSSWWRVEARVGYDRWVASDLIEFSIDTGRRP